MSPRKGPLCINELGNREMSPMPQQCHLHSKDSSRNPATPSLGTFSFTVKSQGIWQQPLTNTMKPPMLIYFSPLPYSYHKFSNMAHTDIKCLLKYTKITHTLCLLYVCTHIKNHFLLCATKYKITLISTHSHLVSKDAQKATQGTKWQFPKLRWLWNS